MQQSQLDHLIISCNIASAVKVEMLLMLLLNGPFSLDNPAISFVSVCESLSNSLTNIVVFCRTKFEMGEKANAPTC